MPLKIEQQANKAQKPQKIKILSFKYNRLFLFFAKYDKKIITRDPLF